MSILPELVFTDDVYRYLDSTNGQILAVNRDIFAGTGKAQLPKDFAKSWSDFLDEWRAVYTKERNDSHMLDAANVMAAIDGFVARLKDYQARANQLGGVAFRATVTAPGVVTDEASTQKPPAGIPTWLYLVLGTALLASFGYSVASVARIGGR